MAGSRQHDCDCFYALAVVDPLSHCHHHISVAPSETRIALLVATSANKASYMKKKLYSEIAWRGSSQSTWRVRLID